MGRTALRLDKRRALRDGTYPVQIVVGYGANLYLSTGIYLQAEEWDARLQVCTGRSARQINNILSTLLSQVSNRVLELRASRQFYEYNSAQLRQMLTDLSLTAPTVGSPTIGEYIRRVISLKSEGTQVVYQTALSSLSRYCDVDKLRISDMSFAWFEAYIRHLEGEGLKRNTITAYIRSIKAAVRYAEDDGVAVNKTYQRVTYRAETDTPMRNLPVGTLRRIMKAQVRRKMQRYLDAFMLSFFLIGINITDLLALPKGCIVNGRLHYRRAKTGKNYSIKVEPEAQAIIDKYPGKEHLLDFVESRGNTFRACCNKFLSSIEPGLTWYWARYSWANYAVELDIPKDVISEALGHKHGSDITGIYIRYSTDKIDVANRKVIDYLLNDKEEG